MTNTILLIYASVDGHTKKISNFLNDQWRQEGKEVFLYEVDEFDQKVENFDTVIIGSSIRYGVHHKSIIDFINDHKETLDKSKTAFFSVNLVARKPEKNQADTNPYVIKFFKSITWRPDLVDVFAGKLDYKKYPYFDRIMIQLIMWMTKGPTDSNAKIEYTDWDRVKTFGEKVLTI